MSSGSGQYLWCAGAFYDLKPLIEEYAPHIKAYLEANPAYEALVTNDDGSIYGLLTEDVQKSSFIFYQCRSLRKSRR